MLEAVMSARTGTARAVPSPLSLYRAIVSCLCMSTPEYGGQRSTLHAVPRVQPAFSLRQGLSLARDSPGGLHEPRDLPVFTSPAQRFQVCSTMSNFLIFLLKMGSGPNLMLMWQIFH